MLIAAILGLLVTCCCALLLVDCRNGGFTSNFWSYTATAPPPPLFYYVPPGVLIPPFGVAYKNNQIAIVAKGNHEHCQNAVVHDGVILNEAGMFAKM